MQEISISRRNVMLFAAAMVSLAAICPRALFAAEASAQRVALQGYDPVSYFTAGKPEKGSAEFTASYDDAVYQFQSAEHRATFVANPDRYAPQYDGFCAINVSRGHKYEPDPQAWTIADGKLYVFTGPKGVPMFLQEKAKIVAEANSRWPALHAQR